MNALKPLSILILAAIAGAGLLFTGCSKGHDQDGGAPSARTLYTCGMHPQVVQDHPGNCPICGMRLTPVRKSGGAGGATNSAAAQPAAPDSQAIALDSVTIQTMGIRKALVTRGPLRRTIRTVGVIDYNEAGLADVSTKFKGWIEKLYVDVTGQQVHRGDPLFEIYSPELYSAQVEYLLASSPQATATPGGEAIRTSARTKLKFYDISEGQIAELERTREATKTLRIVAPMDGFVVEKMVVAGQMVDAGMKTYRLADMSLLWVQAQIYEQDLPYIKLGQEAIVTLSYLADREFRGRVTYIYPNVDEKTRTARVRMEFHNPGYFLKPGMFATVRVTSELEPSALLVPDMAILRSGEKATVFVALDGGKFEPRTVTLGPQAEDDRYQILAGLKEGEQIVTSGQFMLDSESQLREAIQKMSVGGGERSSVGASERGSVGASSTLNAPHAQRSDALTLSRSAPADAAVKFICPMPEHISIQYDHAGNCPICGMALMPVSLATLQRLQPGGKLLYYTCPMPEHSDVHLEKPGKCPKCGMTLIPVMEPPPPPKAAAPALYTCPMAVHADVVSSQPGKCPKCEMDLVPVGSVAHGPAAAEHWAKEHPMFDPVAAPAPASAPVAPRLHPLNH